MADTPANAVDATNTSSVEPHIGEGYAADHREMVTCMIDDVEFGIDLHAVQEIVRLPRITPVPMSPSYVRGLANLRGQVLPVIDPRVRFGMNVGVDSDSCRVIVIDLEGRPTGMIVDAVREVLHISHAAVESPPATIQGLDGNFLSGVVKLNEGRRLVLLVDQARILTVEGVRAATEVGPTSHASTTHGPRSNDAAEEADTAQLVTFRLADEEYAFPIKDVQEIIRVPEITKVPNAPPGTEGITNLRDRVLPILDLRTRFGFPPLAEEMQRFTAAMQEFADGFRAAFEAAERNIQERSHFEPANVSSAGDFSRWHRCYCTADPLIRSLLQPVATAEHTFANALSNIVQTLADGQWDRARSLLESHLRPALADLEISFEKLLRGIARREDERCLVVKIGTACVALRIDAVNEVLQVPIDAIEDTPGLLTNVSGHKKRTEGVAKLDSGARLIMILKPDGLVREEELERIVQAANSSPREIERNEGGSDMSDLKEDSERQLVTFHIGGEEFATDIMQVQEIIRLEKVTAVPNSPEFVEGIVNLRGSVLPVLDLRRRFGMTPIDYSDATRVVVVDVNDVKTGIIVDAVSEVMSLPKRNVEPAPAIVRSSYGDDVIDGVGKLDDGDRMILVLRTDKLLTDDAIATLRDTPMTCEEGDVSLAPSALSPAGAPLDPSSSISHSPSPAHV